MFSGLSLIGTIPSRVPKEEFTTYIDPYNMEAFRACGTQSDAEDLHNWSRSYYSLQSHMDSIIKYNKPILPEPTSDTWIHTKEECLAYADTLPKVRTLSARHDLKNVRYHQGTSAGYGYYRNPQPKPTNKGPPGSPNYQRALGIASKIIHSINTAHSSGTLQQFLDSVPFDTTPDIAFTRTQLSELPSAKVRNVFGEAFHYVLLEGLTAQPLIQHFMNLDSFYYIGQDPTTHVPTLLQSLPIAEGMLYASFDWSQFDASAQPYEIDLAFDFLERICLFPDTDSENTFAYCKKVFMHRHLAAPNGQLFLRYSGIPSGSYFTHIIDSIINWNRIRYLLHNQGAHIHAIYTHGDDCLVAYTCPSFSIDQLRSDSTEKRWILNLDKTHFERESDRLSFLSRSHRLGFNTRPVLRARRLVIYPEYPVDDPQISIARLKAIDLDSGFSDQLLLNMYHYLVCKYGDENKTLPAKFRIYNALEIIPVPGQM